MDKKAGDTLTGVEEFAATRRHGVQGRLAGKIVLVGTNKFMQENKIDLAAASKQKEQLEQQGKRQLCWLRETRF